MGKKIENYEDSEMLSGHNEDAKEVVDKLNANEAKVKTKKVKLFHSKDVALRLAALLKLEGLRVLDLKQVLCEGSQSNSMPNLSILRCNSLIRLPKWWERLLPGRLSTFNISLKKADELAVLAIKRCVVAKDFAEALGNLANLRILDLVGLERLDHLPQNFGNLSRLKVLRLMSLQSLKLCDEFGTLVALENLVLSRIPVLELPNSPGDLRSLKFMHIEEINGLAGLPDTFGRHLQNLTELRISGCPLIKCLPGCFSEPSKLEELSIRDCFGLQELGESFTNLSSLLVLTLIRVGVKTLPANFGRLRALEELTLQFNSLRSVSDDFDQLSALKRLEISSSELEMLPYGFQFLESLETMELLNCSKLERLPGDLGRACSLRHVRIHNCERLRSVPDSWRKPSLPQLEIPHGRESHEVGRQAGKFSQRNAAEEVRLFIYGCPLLDDSVLGSLSGVHVVNAGGSRGEKLDDDNTLAFPPFPADEIQSFNGYWIQRAAKGAMSMELSFATDNGVSGGGSDQYGEFTCTGYWRGSQISFVKQYMSYKLQYDGEISNNTINGAWTCEERFGIRKGEFHLELKAASAS